MSHHGAAATAATLPPTSHPHQSHPHQPPPHQTHGRSSQGQPQHQPQHQPHGPADEPGPKAPWTTLGLMQVWQFALVLTALPALLAIGLLFYNYAAIVTGWAFWPG